jgi:hypothetical protein
VHDRASYTGIRFGPHEFWTDVRYFGQHDSGDPTTAS